MSQLAETLSALREIPGVVAVFLLDPMGRLQAHTESLLFGEETLTAAGQKIGMLIEGAFENLACEEVTLGFEGYSLTLRRSERGVLCTLADSSVSPEALRMGASVVSRRLAMLAAEPAVQHSQPGQAGRPVQPTQQSRVHTQGTVRATGTNRVATGGKGPPVRTGSVPGVSTNSNATGTTGVKRAPTGNQPSPESNWQTKGGKPPKKKNDIWG
jgi:hypothetical protein